MREDSGANAATPTRRGDGRWAGAATRDSDPGQRARSGQRRQGNDRRDRHRPPAHVLGGDDRDRSPAHGEQRRRSRVNHSVRCPRRSDLADPSALLRRRVLGRGDDGRRCLVVVPLVAREQVVPRRSGGGGVPGRGIVGRRLVSRRRAGAGPRAPLGWRNGGDRCRPGHGWSGGDRHVLAPLLRPGRGACPRRGLVAPRPSRTGTGRRQQDASGPGAGSGRSRRLPACERERDARGYHDARAGQSRRGPRSVLGGGGGGSG